MQTIYEVYTMYTTIFVIFLSLCCTLWEFNFIHAKLIHWLCIHSPAFTLFMNAYRMNMQLFEVLFSLRYIKKKQKFRVHCNVYRIFNVTNGQNTLLTSFNEWIVQPISFIFILNRKFCHFDFIVVFEKNNLEACMIGI